LAEKAQAEARTGRGVSFFGVFFAVYCMELINQAAAAFYALLFLRRH